MLSNVFCFPNYLSNGMILWFGSLISAMVFTVFIAQTHQKPGIHLWNSPTFSILSKNHEPWAPTHTNAYNYEP